MVTLPCADSPPGALLRCSAPPARCRAEQREEVQHRQNPPAVPRRHLPRDPEPEKPERVGGQERKGRAGLSFGQGEHQGTRGWGVVGAEPPGSRRAPLPARGRVLLSSPLQDQKILLSIYNISMSLREVAAGTLRGPEELAVWKVARNTDFVLRENCRKISKSLPRIPAQPRHGGPGRRRKQLREIGRKAERLATCWEKLYALHAPRRAPRDS
ncbi:uncharacterized protein C20orf204 homolog isoform 2-T2 [Theristicus caerulescens]